MAQIIASHHLRTDHIPLSALRLVLFPIPEDPSRRVALSGAKLPK